MIDHTSSKISRKEFISFTLGITFGLSFAYLLLGSFTMEDIGLTLWYRNHYFPLKERNDTLEPLLKSKEGSSSEAEELTREIRVMCLVLTMPYNHESKAKAVNETWGKRCSVLLFVSTSKSEELPTVVVEVEEGYETLWGKSKKGFIYAYENYLDAADWFLKADDDTYVVMENLRYMLGFHSPDEPVYFGRKFRNGVGQAYMSGGAGYVLSREALKRLVEIALPKADICKGEDNGAEDKEMGRCLESVNVTSGVSRDKDGRGRFFPFSPEYHLIPGNLDTTLWYWEFTNTTSTEGADCCSDTAISFHYIEPDQMYVLEYALYNLHPHGTRTKLKDSIPPKPSSETLKRLNPDT